MKKIALFLLLSLCFINLYSQKDWRLYTNTTYIRDLATYNDDIAIATWGGLEFYSPRQRQMSKTMTIMDGLKGNDIYALGKYGQNELLLAIYNLSVDRLVGNKLDVSLSQAMGLSSLQIYAIHTQGNYIFIGGENGLTIFQKEEYVSFPVFFGSYNTSHGFRVVNTITSDDNGFVYMGTNAGISRVHSDSLGVRSAWKNYTLPANETVTSLAVCDNVLAISTSLKTFYKDKDTYGWYTANQITPTSTETLYNGASFSNVKVYRNGDSHIIYSVFGGWRNNRDQYVADTKKLIYNSQNVLTDTLFCSVLIYDLQNASADTLYWGKRQILSNSPATNVLLSGNDLYITTWGDGLYHLNMTNKQLIAHAKNNSIQSNSITAIAIDKNHLVWFADGANVDESPTATKGVASYNIRTNSWNYYNVSNSDLISNNIKSIGVDSENKKWFGGRWAPASVGWGNGISILDDSESGIWRRITSNPFSLNVNMVWSLRSSGGKMWVATIGNSSGVSVIDEATLNFEAGFYATAQNRASYVVNIINNRCFVGTGNGLYIWQANTMPAIGTATHQSALNSGTVYSIEPYYSEYSTQVWFASSSGLKMYDMTSNGWYYYDTDIKRRVWREGAWSDDQRYGGQLYFSDEDRLWGSEAATPSCLIVDPFDRVWIGSVKSGLAMYDIKIDRFFNYKTTNSPLVSNEIITLAYHATAGLLYISTPIGVMTVDIGIGEKTSVSLNEVDVYPNPYKPAIHTNGVTIEVREGSFPKNSSNECRIFDFSGQVVRVLVENGRGEGFGRFVWDGNTSQGKQCAPGVYFYLIKTDIGESSRGKIVLIR